MNADRDWAFSMYETFGRGGDDEALYYVVIDGDPWSKSRPRFTRRGRTYQPRDDSAAEEAMRRRLQAAGAQRFTGNVMLACRFYRSNYQRIDADNLLKHVCDSATGILWQDDSQVTLVLGDIQFDKERPRTVIVAGNHYSTLERGDDALRPCTHCDKPFMPTPGRPRDEQRFCSSRCSYAARTTVLAEITCPQCRKSFRPRTKTQIVCSRTCAGNRLTGQNRAKGGPMSCCTDCGKELAHRRGGRCRDCWRKDPGFYPKTEVVQ